MGYRILIVEDDATLTLGLRDVLGRLGHDVIGSVSTGSAAIRDAEAGKPDVILMDISLAGPMNGIQAAERIRQTLEIPVVFITAHSDPATLLTAQGPEPYGFILKPFDIDDLRVAIELACHKHRADARVRQSERRYATILRAIGDAVISTDSLGRVDFINPAAAGLIGLAPEDAIGKPLASFLTLLDPASRTALAVELSWSGEALLVDGSGREIPVAGSITGISSSATEVSGQAGAGHVLTIRDISEERRTADLRESQRVEQIIGEVSEIERRQFGQDLHDGLGQMLTGAALLCRALEQKLTEKSQLEAADARNIGKLLVDASHSARRLATGLLPVPDKPDGLSLALEKLADQIASQCQIQCSFSDVSPVLISDSAAASHLFRIAQEAVNNAVKHAGASRIDISLQNGSLIVRDDGIGIPSNFQSRGSGLDIMQHRASAIGGLLRVSADPSGGTAVICSFPLKA